jgi:abhydrolase domain-containing protein 14
MTSEIRSSYVSIQGSQIHVLEAGDMASPSILFLHGASFRGRTWEELGTFDLLVSKGYRAVALDLPGYGSSARFAGRDEEFLLRLLPITEITRPVLVSPSMSGRYSLPLVAAHADQLSGFVAIAPVGIDRFQDKLKGNRLPTLALWGSPDRIVPVQQADLLVELMPNARKVVLEGAGHACYMRATEDFHQHILEFVKQCFAQ